MLKTFVVSYIRDKKYRNTVIVKALHRNSASNKVKALNSGIKIESITYIKG